MDTKARYGLNKGKAVLLFLQMILIIFVSSASIYLLYFVSANGLGEWMIASYILISLSLLSIIIYAIIGYKKGKVFYIASIAPFLGTILTNIMLSGKSAYQIAMLSLLLALTFGFLLVQGDKRLGTIISLLMVLAALAFFIYSSTTANIQFLGPVEDNVMTYISMYTSIFIPVIMTGTIALTYTVRLDREGN